MSLQFLQHSPASSPSSPPSELQSNESIKGNDTPDSFKITKDAIQENPSLPGELLLACKEDNWEQVGRLLHNEKNLSASDPSGKTALHFCVQNSSTCCSELLLATDKSIVNIVDNEGYSALHLAVIAGNVDLVKLLLKSGADTGLPDAEMHVALHWSIVCGHLDVFNVIMAHGASTSARDMHGAHPLHYAAQMCAPSLGPKDAAKGLQMLQKLIEAGALVNEPDNDGRQPLQWAASAGSEAACIALVKAGAKVNAKDSDGLTALHCAASRGYDNCITALLDTCSAFVDTTDRNGCTALFYAVTMGHSRCVRLLLSSGASPNHQDSKGRSSSHCAALKGNLALLRELKEAGAQFNCRSNKGELPIHEAASASHTEQTNPNTGVKITVETVIQLIEWDPEPKEVVNASNQNGRTCLHLAAMTNNLELCRLLLERKANVNAVMVQDDVYTSVYDAAISRNNTEMADYIWTRGGMKGRNVTHQAAISIQRQVRDTFLRPDWNPGMALLDENHIVQIDDERALLQSRLEGVTGSDLRDNTDILSETGDDKTKRKASKKSLKKSQKKQTNTKPSSSDISAKKSVEQTTTTKEISQNSKLDVAPSLSIPEIVVDCPEGEDKQPPQVQELSQNNLNLDTATPNRSKKNESKNNLKSDRKSKPAELKKPKPPQSKDSAQRIASAKVTPKEEAEKNSTNESGLPQHKSQSTRSQSTYPRPHTSMSGTRPKSPSRSKSPGVQQSRQRMRRNSVPRQESTVSSEGESSHSWPSQPKSLTSGTPDPNIISGVQKSVIGYERQRTLIHEMQRLRKTMMYGSHMTDNQKLRYLMQQHRRETFQFPFDPNQIRTVTHWENYLLEQIKLVFKSNEARRKKTITPTQNSQAGDVKLMDKLYTERAQLHATQMLIGNGSQQKRLSNHITNPDSVVQERYANTRQLLQDLDQKADDILHGARMENYTLSHNERLEKAYRSATARPERMEAAKRNVNLTQRLNEMKKRNLNNVVVKSMESLNETLEQRVSTVDTGVQASSRRPRRTRRLHHRTQSANRFDVMLDGNTKLLEPKHGMTRSMEGIEMPPVDMSQYTPRFDGGFRRRKPLVFVPPQVYQEQKRINVRLTH